ncbi:MAG: sugar ABC transporter permease [Armatimonadota bacterium]|nr:sugar ABC transporter permease [Armatimonadota bacterium]MDR7464023.1 sugar ABC transporter permease [Armatimonadota bacterium]MDR7468907.1 sugar ABC transporter permease [Armatimonadota bacterium]MDR7474852.1 sugar ABC transporter permease [Armatimonadota bacterium]MDR7539697.1 sugar ABC transporter permease [Armatimonadota bacterium]
MRLVALPRRRYREARYAYATVLPVVLLVALFTIYPLLFALITSLREVVLYRPWSQPFVGLKNYLDVVRSEFFASAWAHTLTFVVGAVPLATVLGFAIAHLLNGRSRLAAWLNVTILLPWAIPTVISGIIWAWIFNSSYGAFNGALYSLGLIDSYVPWLSRPRSALLCVLFAHVWKEVPLTSILYLAALQAIPDELYDAARVDGAGTLGILRRVTVPLLLPTTLIIVVYETMVGIVTFDLLYVMTGGGPAGATSLISYYLYNSMFVAYNFGQGAALAVLLAAALVVFILVYMRLLRSEEIYAT